MRISDWSSAVCSSDLSLRALALRRERGERRRVGGDVLDHLRLHAHRLAEPRHPGVEPDLGALQLAVRGDRKGVGSGKSVSESVDIGVGLIIKKQDTC